MEIKELLLKNISENKYFDICNFIEEIYLMEYDVLILMARKFFNLFCVFHKENCLKYERLKIPYQNKGIIVTNRALPLIKNDILKNNYKKVVIADDILIHGRSIREVYQELIDLCPELDVLLMSYVRNNKDITAYADIFERVQSRYEVEVHEWKELSDEILNVFYMSGQPYISYLPYFLLDIEWEKLLKKLSVNNCISIEDEDMIRRGIKAYMYVGKEIDVFKHLKCCKICVIRFYYYSKVNKVIAIPYFLMNTMRKKNLEKISDFLRKNYLTTDYQELVERNNNADEMRIMEFEYVLSAWMSMYLFNKLDISVTLWNKEIEKYNFCKWLIPYQILSEQTIVSRVTKIKEIDIDILNEENEMNKDISILLDEYSKLKKIYYTNFTRWKKMDSWGKVRVNYERRFMDNYLLINGNIDEERCKNGTVEKKRLFGMPVAFILKDMAEYLDELFGNEKNREDYINQVFAALIVSIDSGRGTIVTKVEGTNLEDQFVESVIYAGEQNYKFYDYTNYPIMYGLYLIEEESYEQSVPNEISTRKSLMIDRFTQYLDEQKVFYIREEMVQISNLNLSVLFKKFLQNSYEKYYGNTILDKAVTLAMEICNNK